MVNTKACTCVYRRKEELPTLSGRKTVPIEGKPKNLVEQKIRTLYKMPTQEQVPRTDF